MEHILPVFFWSLFPTFNKYAQLLFSSYLCKTASLGLSSFLLLFVHLLNSACFDGAGSYLRGVWRHIHITPTGKALGTSRFMPAQPSTSAWHDLMHANTMAPTSPKSSSAVLALWRMPVRQGLLTWVQHHSDGGFAMPGVSHWLPQLLAVLVPAMCVLLPCPKSRIHITARNVVIPSRFSFAYLKGSSLSYWAINRKIPWLHLWLLLCRSNITAAVIALCMWSLRGKKEKSETKASGSRVLKESCNLPTLQPAGCSSGRLSKFHCIKLRVERKKITRATAQDKREDKAKKYKGYTQSSSFFYFATWMSFCLKTIFITQHELNFSRCQVTSTSTTFLLNTPFTEASST